MKKVYTLVVFFLCVNASVAQEVSVGQPSPDAAFSNVINGVAPVVALSDLRGTPLLVGFWNTHCSVGRQFLPMLDSIRKELRGKVGVLLVTAEAASTVKKAFADVKRLKGLQLPVAVADTSFRKYFPHRIEPHFVWINEKGVVAGITGHEVITVDNLWAFAHHEPLALPLKKDIADPAILYSLSPLWLNSYGENKTRLSYAGYLGEERPGLVSLIRAAMYNSEDSTVRITAVNQTVFDLYRLAYKKFQNFHRTLFINENEAGRRKNGEDSRRYCYDLTVKDTSLQKAYDWMAMDLDRCFSFQSRLEKRVRPVLVLIRRGKKNRLKAEPAREPDNYETEGRLVLQNVPLRIFVQNTLNARSLLPLPVVDETSYDGRVDLEMTTDYANLPSIRRSLRRYGLDLKPARRVVDVIVVNEKKSRR